MDMTGKGASFHCGNHQLRLPLELCALTDPFATLDREYTEDRDRCDEQENRKRNRTRKIH